jgi:hypothetical protein
MQEKRSVRKRDLGIAAVEAQQSECTFMPVLNHRSKILANDRSAEKVAAFVKSKLRTTARMR